MNNVQAHRHNLSLDEKVIGPTPIPFHFPSLSKNWRGSEPSGLIEACVTRQMHDQHLRADIWVMLAYIIRAFVGCAFVDFTMAHLSSRANVNRANVRAQMSGAQMSGYQSLRLCSGLVYKNMYSMD